MAATERALSQILKSAILPLSYVTRQLYYRENNILKQIRLIIRQTIVFFDNIKTNFFNSVYLVFDQMLDRDWLAFCLKAERPEWWPMRTARRKVRTSSAVSDTYSGGSSVFSTIRGQRTLDTRDSVTRRWATLATLNSV